MAEELTTELALSGILALLAADRAEREPEPRLPTEVLLHGVGLTNGQIASFVGEKADTVRKRIERAEKAGGRPRKAGRK